MNEPVWLSRLLVDAMQLDQIREHGGQPGIRDENLLESALARPQNKFAYEGTSDLPELAAAYGYGLARNHAYVDGNKRIAFVAMYVFLGMNGFEIEAPEPEVVDLMLHVASGDKTEGQLAVWLREHLASVGAE
jgi:death-on-curing protein